MSELHHLSKKQAEELQKQLKDDPNWDTLSDFFKVFGDPARLRILTLLDKNEMCVNDLSIILEMTPSAVSHQLRMLRQSRLVEYRKEGKHTLYHLNDHHIGEILTTGRSHVNE